MSAIEQAKIGFQVFLKDGGEEVGAVRDIRHGELVVYVENAGEFVVPAAAIHAVHSEKVILDATQLDAKLTAAIRHAHDAEVPGL
jgi:hypothetical protein